MFNKLAPSRAVRSINTLVCISAMAMGVGLSQPVQASEPYIGQIETFGFNFAPRGWTTCDGQLLAISQNTALFALLGTTFGGDGETTFALPDLRGRVAVHVGSGPGLTPVTWGQRGGTETVTLTVNNLPSHSHTATATLNGINRPGNSSVPGGNTLASKARTNIYQTAAPDVAMQAGSVTVSVGNTGANQPVNVRNPYLGIYHAIALTGIFPSRN